MSTQKLRAGDWPDLMKQTFREWSDDKAPMLGAALSFYTIFSLAPILVIALAVSGFFYGAEAARGGVSHQIQDLVGVSAAQAIQSMVENARFRGGGILASVLGIALLLFGAGGVFGALKEAMNVVWKAEPPRKGGILVLIKDRFLSFAMVLGVAFLLLVSLVMSAAISGLAGYVTGSSPTLEPLMHSVDILLSLGIVTLLFAMIYRFLPDVRIAWRDVWLGAFITSALFVIGKSLLGLYLGRSAVASSYGAAGSMAVILLWIYYSAQIALFGAEFTQVYARRFGSLAHEPAKTKNEPYKAFVR